MICPYCGKDTPESSSICKNCGRWLVDEGLTNTSEQSANPPEKSPTESSVIAEQPMRLDEISSPVQVEPVKNPSRGGFDKYFPWLLGCFVVFCLIASCITLIWGFYRFSNVLDFIKAPTPIPTPTPVPSLIFSDDFSDPSSGWPSSNESDYIDDYYNGAYRMVENQANMTSWAYPAMDPVNDMIVEVESTKNGGPDENNMGVMCRFQDNNKFYYGLVTSDGYYGIVKRTQEEFIVIGHEYLEFSDWINQGNATNHIRLECIGEVLTLYVNGNLIDQQMDADYSFGEAGLIIATYDTPGTDILFDNFMVFTP